MQVSNASPNYGPQLVTLDNSVAQISGTTAGAVSTGVVTLGKVSLLSGWCVNQYYDIWAAIASGGGSGSVGPSGAIGPQGPQGIQGIPGSSGASIVGPSGAMGLQGLTGPSGDRGFSGANGVQGISGVSVTGPSGAQGPQGIPGISGVSIIGPSGERGFSGANGALGPSGAQGLQGIQGLTGPTGAVGSSGANGAQGIQGPSGAQGFSGASIIGSPGASGANGAAGPSGAQGPIGLTGPSGAQGLSGMSIVGTSGSPGTGASFAYVDAKDVAISGLTLAVSGILQSQIIVPSLYLAIATDPAGFTLTSMAVAEGFLNASPRMVAYMDLAGYASGRLIINKQATTGWSTAYLTLKYRGDFNQTATNYLPIASPPISGFINVQNVMIVTPWQPLVAAAKSGVYVSVNMTGGNGTLSPVMGNIYAQFR